MVNKNSKIIDSVGSFRDNVWRIVETSPIVLPVNSQYYREPPRSYDEMTEGYLTRYDGHTIAADVFTSNSDVFFIGPPLLNLKAVADSSYIKIDGEQHEKKEVWEDLNRISRLRLPVPTVAETIEVTFGNESFTVRTQRTHSEVFAGKNTVVTLNKDNHLHNIRDWVTNLVRNHGIDCAIVYDNRSTTYTRSELLATLKAVPGLVSGFVVDWPYKYGNTGGPKQIWDSDFGQYMCWEHARWRFLRRANCVVICDVDEIPVSSSDRTLVDLAHDSATGVYSYPVRDCPPVPRPNMAQDRVRLHSDYLYSDLVKGPRTRKIVYMPSRLPRTAQVANHQVIGVGDEYSEEVISRHVQGVHLAWREGKFVYSDKEREFNSATDFYDQELKEVYKQTYPSEFSED